VKTSLINTSLIVVLAILSIAAGIPKILQMQQELGFLKSIGFNESLASMLGIIQAGGGILLAWSRTRLLGLFFAALALLVSSVAIFATGNAFFGVVSLMPLILAAILAARIHRSREPDIGNISNDA